MKNFLKEHEFHIIATTLVVSLVFMITVIIGFLFDVNMEQIHREVKMENISRGRIYRESPDMIMKVSVSGKLYEICVDHYFVPLYGNKPKLPNPMHNAIAYQKEINAFDAWSEKSGKVYLAVNDYLSTFGTSEFVLTYFRQVFDGYEYGDRKARKGFAVQITGEELGISELLHHVNISLHDPVKFKELPGRYYTDYLTVFFDRFSGPFESHL